MNSENTKIHTNQKNKLFISHSSKDVEYVKAFVNLLEDIGVPEDAIVCSSVTGYGIPLGEDIYDWLSMQFQKYKLHIIFMLSNNYYKSVACLNEMGAAWVLKQEYYSILLPEFDFVQIKGAINPNRIGIKLDNEIEELNHRLNELKDALIEQFSLNSLSVSKWERLRNQFVKTIKEIDNDLNEKNDENLSNRSSSIQISKDAKILLVYSANSSNGEIIVLRTMSGLTVKGGKWNFVKYNGGAREESRWQDAIIELVNLSLISDVSNKGEIFRVTTKGYKTADNIIKNLSINTEISPEEYLQ